jgi:hypothetical protein
MKLHLFSAAAAAFLGAIVSAVLVQLHEIEHPAGPVPEVA